MPNFIRNNILPLTVFGAVAAVLLVVRLTTSPSLNRNWRPEQAALAEIKVYGNDATIHNLRNSEPGAPAGTPPTYEDRVGRLDQIEKIWLVVERKGFRRAHVMVSFQFAGGNYILFSPEPRLEKGETFSALRGVLRQFELVYIVASERDAIGTRTNVLNHSVQLYEMHLDETGRRKLFLDMAERADRLARDPEFYHTIFNNVTGNIMDHMKSVAPRPSSGWPAWPSRPERVAYSMGMLRPDTSMENLAIQGLITDLAHDCRGREDFSDCIRKTIGNLSEGL